MSVTHSRQTRRSLLAVFMCAIPFWLVNARATAPEPAPDGSIAAEHQFDFLLGNWKVANHRLNTRMANSPAWIDFDAFDSFHTLPGGLGTEENYRTDYWPKFAAIGLHLFDPSKKQWLLYWADNKNSPGVMQTLATGSFAGDTGTFYGSDTLNGQPIIVRIIWKRLDADHARWEQAFSNDNRASWETNWTMDFVRRR